MRVRAVTALACAIAIASGSSTRAAELKPATIAAFDRYQRAAEAAIAADIETPDHFLRVFQRDPKSRRNAEEQLRRGNVAIARLQVTDGGKRVEIPDGLLHHWVGTIFIPGAKIDDVVAFMQDYDHYQVVFKSAIPQSRLIDRDGRRIHFSFRFSLKRIITVNMNTESIADYVQMSPERVVASIRSIRIQEVADAGTPQERERPVGRGGGYLWRFNTYWRFLEGDGGTYLECESVSLTRNIPLGLGWLIGPFVTSIPRDLLTSTLQATRRALTGDSGALKAEPQAGQRGDGPRASFASASSTSTVF